MLRPLRLGTVFVPLIRPTLRAIYLFKLLAYNYYKISLHAIVGIDKICSSGQSFRRKIILILSLFLIFQQEFFSF